MDMLSVVISTHQRRDMTRRLLDALEAQDVDGDGFEVIVVADGCTDGTADQVRSRRHRYGIRVLEQPQSGLAAARNNGARLACGDVLVFLDDDIVPAPDFLRRLREPFAVGADMALPFVRVADWIPDVLLAREQRAWDASVLAAMQGGEVGIDHVHFICTAVRRSCFETLGGFDTSFTSGGAWGREDTEFAFRFLQAGYRVAPLPDLVVDSDCVTDPVVALRRGRELGVNDVRFARKHPSLVEHLFGSGLRNSWIQRSVGRVALPLPGARPLLAPLRWLVVRAVERGWGGALLYRLWLVVWSWEWWRGVGEAGGYALLERQRP